LQLKQSDLCGSLTPEVLVQFAAGLNFPTLLQYNVYRYTNPRVIRNLHDLPSLRPWYGCDDKLCLYGTFFLNEMPKAYFTHCGKTVTDYLFVSKDDALIQALENLAPDADVPTIIPLFNGARLQMHRLGVMLGASKCFGNLRFNAAVPVYYLAWNFFLNQTEVDALNATPFFNGGQPLSNDQTATVGYSTFDPNTFIDRHLVSELPLAIQRQHRQMIPVR